MEPDEGIDRYQAKRWKSAFSANTNTLNQLCNLSEPPTTTNGNSSADNFVESLTLKHEKNVYTPSKPIQVVRSYPTCPTTKESNNNLNIAVTGNGNLKSIRDENRHLRSSKVDETTTINKHAINEDENQVSTCQTIYCASVRSSKMGNTNGIGIETTTINEDAMNEVEVESQVSTRQKIYHANYLETTITSKGDFSNVEDDEVQVLYSTVINPSIIYPHPRHLCGVYPFSKAHNHEENQRFCSKCYCSVCDVIASSCSAWIGEQGHCNRTRLACDAADSHNTSDDEKEEDLTVDGGDGLETIVIDDSDNSNISAVNVPNGRLIETIMIDDSDEESFPRGKLMDVDLHVVRDKLKEVKQTVVQAIANSVKAQSQYISIASRKNMTIKEIFLSNLRSSSRFTADIGFTDGDIPSLNRQSNFFIEGVHIGWPYPKIMLPQRLIALHLIKAFKTSKHVAIESPTGTGAL